MITSSINRHAKPYAGVITTAVPKSNVRFLDTLFSNSIETEPRNLSTFDILDVNGRVLDRMGNVNGNEYSQLDGRIQVAKTGLYVLRVYDNVHDQDSTSIKINAFNNSDGSRGVMGVRFWPEILTQPSKGAARLSLDGEGIAIIVDTPGQYAFSYQMRNYLGQVSESSCVFVTVV